HSVAPLSAPLPSPTRRSSDLVFSGFYYYYVATGDPLAKKALVQLAQFRYRHGQLDYFFSRSSALLQAFALAWRETHEAIYAAYLDRKSTRLNSSHEWISYAVF